MIPTMTTYAAEQQSNLPYSRFWETQADGSWKYKYDDGTYATGWIQDDVDGNWYYMDSAGIMKSGLYKSYDRYYLLSSLHDGHYGHLLTNGEVYQGVTISADTSETYRGALSQQTISQLGLDVSKAIDITGTQHVKGGQVVTPEQPQQNPTQPSTPQPQKDTPDPILPVSEDGDNSNDSSDDGEGLMLNLDRDGEEAVYEFE